MYRVAIKLAVICVVAVVVGLFAIAIRPSKPIAQPKAVTVKLPCDKQPGVKKTSNAIYGPDCQTVFSWSNDPVPQRPSH